MSEIFGRLWESSNGHVGGDVYQTWARELVKLDSRQLARGLGKIVESGDEFPPNLVRFLKLCRETRAACHERLMIEADKPETPQSRDKASRALAAMRKNAGMQPKPLPQERVKRPTRLLTKGENDEP